MSPDQGSPTETSVNAAASEVSNTSAQKRKASSPHPEDAPTASPKRAKVSDGAGGLRDGPAKSPTALNEKEPNRRLSVSQEEKRRGKRLFGGLLSTLSQATPSSQQRKRQAIERRQQEKAHQRRAEDDKQREEKLAKLMAVRKVEQVKFEEQAMRTRHADLLATAQFLRTKSEPEIYYLPWETTAEQEDIIKDQVKKAKDSVEKEVRDFKQHKQERLKSLGVPAEPSEPPAQVPEKEPAKEPEMAKGSGAKAAEPTKLEKSVGKTDTVAPPDPPQSESTNPSSSNPTKVVQQKEPDETGELMVEDEDTVIY